MTFTLQFLDDFFPVTALPLVISPCSRVSVGRDEQTCRGCEKIRAKTVSARPIPLSFFFFLNPACSFVPSLRTESLEPAISDRTSGVKELLDP